MVAVLPLLLLPAAVSFLAVLPSPALAYAQDPECSEGETPIDGECVPNDCVHPHFQTGEPSLCGGGGICQLDTFTHEYTCGCDLGFLWDEVYGCRPTYCQLVEGVICKFGKCEKNKIGFYQCVCDEGYIMDTDRCVSEACLAIPDRPISLCSGQGECFHNAEDDTWACECDVWHAGPTCQECSDRAFEYNGVCEDLACQVILPDGTVTLCNDLGSCYHPYNSNDSHCLCAGESINTENDCIFGGCYNWPQGDTLCSNRGICTGYGCKCDPGFGGPICEYENVPDCAEGTTLLDYSRCLPDSCVFGAFENINLNTECSGHGTCSPAGQCECDEGFVFMAKRGCVPASCYDAQSGELCHQGQCDLDPRDDIYKCFCNEGFIMVDDRCVRAACYFPSFADPSKLSECAGLGHCTMEDGAYVCDCEDHSTFLKGAGCVPNPCVVDGEVCPNGVCAEEGGKFGCACEEPFQLVAGTCIHKNCVSVNPSGSLVSCGGPESGVCTQGETGAWACECLGAFTGQLCQDCEDGARKLDGYCVSERCIVQFPGEGLEESICGGAGRCRKDAVLGWKCVCDDPNVGRDFYCGAESCLEHPDDVQFCNAHGMCRTGECLCEEGYSGAHCEIEPTRCPTGEVMVDGACVDSRCVFNGLLCGGGGRCDLSGALPKCVCDAGFEPTEAGCTAAACVTYDENGVHACTQHGSCLPGSAAGGFACVCDPIFRGSLCEICDSEAAIVVDGVCTSLSCMSTDPLGSKAVCSYTGSCALVAGAYSCVCPEGEETVDGECVSSACMTERGEPCNHHGVCRFGTCQCEAGWAGEKCEEVFPDKCDDGFVYLEGACVPLFCLTGDSVCNSHGSCRRAGSQDDEWACDCEGPWSGELCDVSTACPTGKVFADGECIPEACAFPSIANDGSLSLCGGKGAHTSCVEGGDREYRCLCIGDWEPSETHGCLPAACDIEGTGVSCPHGACQEKGSVASCVCSAGYTLVDGSCVSLSCAKPGAFGATVCSEVGECVEYETDVWGCECPGFLAGPYCEYCAVGSQRVGEECISDRCILPSEDGEARVCNLHGECVQDGDDWRCECAVGAISLDGSCFPPSCFASVDDERPCSGHGVCDADSCVCEQNYRGEHCEEAPPECGEGEALVDYACVDLACVVDGTVCGGHGECVAAGSSHACSCDVGFIMTTRGCVALSCIRVEDGISVPCGNNGVCVEAEDGQYVCECSQLATGQYCQTCSEAALLVNGVCVSKECAHELPYGEVSVCSNEGICVSSEGSFGIVSYSCSCKGGYTSIDGQCVSAVCLSNGRQPESCSSHGYCQLGLCHCDPYWAGETCSEKVSEPCPEGFTYLNDECLSDSCYWHNDVCSGHGACREPAEGIWKCYCDKGWSGQWCQWDF